MITINEKFMENVPAAFILTNSNGIILKINNYAIKNLKNFGYSSITSIDEIDPRLNVEALHRGSQIQCITSIADSIIDVEISKVTYEGDSSCLLYVFKDEEYKTNERNIVFNLIDDIVVVVNKNKIIESYNDALVRITGIGKEEFIGRSVYEIKDDFIKGESVTLKVFEAKKPLTMNVEYKNGTYLTFTGKPIYDKKGEVRKVIATGRDITELVNLEKKLKKKQKKRKKITCQY